MRILMLAQFYPPIIGGEERHVRNLSIDLVSRGHDVTVATLWYPGAKAEEEESGVKVRRLRGTMQKTALLFKETERRHAPPFPDPELLYGLRRLVLSEKPDIVHAHNWMLHSYLPLKHWSGVPLAVTLHDFSMSCAIKSLMRDGVPCSGPSPGKCLPCAKQHYGMAKGAVTVFANWASSVIERRTVDTFIAVSKAVAEGNSLPESGVPFEVIPNFVPDRVAALSADPGDGVRALPEGGYILFCGDLSRNKGVPNLLEAYASLENAPPLVLIGRASPDEAMSLPANVFALGSWPHGDIMHAWSQCLFGVAPSIWADPCPTVVMEAMSCGKAVIASTIGGSPDLVDHGKTGYLIAPGDIAGLADAMRRLIADPECREKMASEGLRKVETLKASAVVPRIENLYKRLCSARSQPASMEARHAA
jgi:glycosyltransferase involved in cell wall biosynthesis